MKEETQRWLDKAAEDLESASYMLDGERVEPAGFFAQQCAEKALKAVIVEREGRFARVHDLVVLARDAKAPDNLVDKCAALSPAYVAYRYPDVEIPLTVEECRGFIDIAKEVQEWATSQLS